VVYYSLNYRSDSSDRALINRLLAEAEHLAGSVNRGRANDSDHNRTYRTVLANCIAGVVSEYFWKLYLNENGNYVQSTTFDDPTAQIDLEVIRNQKKIEVRSSFPRKGVEFAICHPIYQFDILGPYSNNYKPGEVEKDFYVRTLFHLEQPSQIIDRIKQDHFVLCLTGGATWDMMWNRNSSLEKDLIPEDKIGILTKSSYRVVPFCSALGTKEIKQLIIGNVPRTNPKPASITSTHEGYCIRCGEQIEYCYGQEKPRYYCKECWRVLYHNGADKNQKENYCHKCGRENKSSFERPLCYRPCWKNL